MLRRVTSATPDQCRSVMSAALQMLLVALVHSRLDYGNGVLVGLSAYLMRQLQSMLNAATRLIYRLRTCDHVIDALVSLYWLQVPQRRQYKLVVLTYKVLHGHAPQYLGPLFRVYDQHSRQTLHSTKSSRLVEPPVKLSTVGIQPSCLLLHTSGIDYQLTSLLPTHYLTSRRLLFFISAIISRHYLLTFATSGPCSGCAS